MHSDSSIIISRCRCSWHVPNVCTWVHTDSCSRDDLPPILLKYVVTKFKCVNGASFLETLYTYSPGVFPTWVPGMVPTPAAGMTYAPNIIPTPAPGMTYAPGVFPTWVPGMVPTPAPGMTYAPWVPGMVPMGKTPYNPT